MPLDPLQGVQKLFLAPARFEKFLDHNLQVLDSTRLVVLNIKDFSSSDKILWYSQLSRIIQDIVAILIP